MANYARPLRPAVHVAGDWRGAQLWSLGDDTAVLRVRAEQQITCDYTIARALLPAGVTVGEPVQVLISNVGAGTANYTIAEVHDGLFPRGDCPLDNAASVAAGIFTPSIITREHGGPSRYYDGD